MNGAANAGVTDESAIQDGAAVLATDRPRTLLICHAEAPLHFEELAAWLASWSELVGIVIIDEPPRRKWQRVRRELRRSGVVGFADVMAFRLLYRLREAGSDARWLENQRSELRKRFGRADAAIPRIHVKSPNDARTRAFMSEAAPDMAFALCKTILKPEIFSIPTMGTYVFHPGVCPTYRNAHGCFWALARGDHERVGMTLLRIDAGIDTGPVYGYFSYPYDAMGESHVRIQTRVVTDNLDPLRDALLGIARGNASRVDTSGQESAEGGQPKLSAYLRLRRLARGRRA